MKAFARQLSAGTEAVVVALSDTEVGKLFPDGALAAREAEKLEFANGVNGLMSKLLRVDTYDPTGGVVLVLERLRSLDFRSAEVERRSAYLDVFVDELEELHTAGFIHGHVRREPGFTSEPWDNIILTNTGLRLIDAGRAILREAVTEGEFDQALRQEREALEAFREYLLHR
jgi:hypothetical protein